MPRRPPHKRSPPASAGRAAKSKRPAHFRAASGGKTGIGPGKRRLTRARPKRPIARWAARLLAAALAVIGGVGIGYLSHRAAAPAGVADASAEGSASAAPQRVQGTPAAPAVDTVRRPPADLFPLPTSRPSVPPPAWVDMAAATPASRPVHDGVISQPHAQAGPVVAPTPSVAPPRVAIVIDDLGINVTQSAAVIALPAPLTLAFLPYGPDLPLQTRLAARRGHELLVHLPMQPLASDVDPGPGALRVDQTAADIRAIVQAALAQFTGYRGVNNHMGSRFTADPAGMRALMGALDERELFFLDSRTTPTSVADEMAADAGVPFIGRDIFLDHVRAPTAIRQALADVEALAQRDGAAVAIGHPYPETIAALAEWLPRARSRGLLFVPVSTLVASPGGASP